MSADHLPTDEQVCRRCQGRGYVEVHTMSCDTNDGRSAQTVHRKEARVRVQITGGAMNAQNRLQRIKIDAEDFEYPDEILNRSDILWLISEAERLERKADDAVMLIHKLQAENEQLRAAVSKCTGELGCEAYKLAGTADETSPSTREPPVDPDSDVPPAKAVALCAGCGEPAPCPQDCPAGTLTPSKASETPQHDFRGPTVACRCGWFGHPNALVGLKCPKCSAEFK